MVIFLGNYYRFKAEGGGGGVAWSRRRSGLESQEEWPGVAGGAAWSRRRSGLESQEERPGVTGGVAWSRRRSGMESQEESSGDQGGAPWSSKFCTGLLPAILIFNILKIQMLPTYQGTIWSILRPTFI